MNDFDLEAIEKSFEEYKRIVNEKHWADLTIVDIEYVTDIEKRKQFKNSLRYIINPLLYHMKSMRNFKFSHSDNELTCRNMLKDIFDYYQKLGFNRKDIAHIACDRSNKKH